MVPEGCRAARARRTRREGSGVLLVLVMVILLVIIVAGFGQGVFSSQVVSQTQRASLGNMCQYLAESASEEAFFVVQAAANTPGSPLFTELRDHVFGEGPAPFDLPWLTASSLKHTVELLDALPEGGNFTLEGVEVRVAFRRPMTTLSYETFGTFHVTATASAGLLTGIRRTVDVYRDFKVALLSPPRPFGKVAVFLGSARNVLKAQAPNNDIKLCYRQIRVVWQLFKKIEDKARSDGSSEQQGKAREARERVEEAAGTYLLGKDEPAVSAPYDWDQNPQPPADEAEGPHYFGDPEVRGEQEIESPEDLMLMVGPAADEPLEVDLGALDLLAVVEPLDELRKPADEELQKALDHIKEHGDNNTVPSEEDQKGLVDKAVASVLANRAILMAYGGFQQLLGEKTGESKRFWDEEFVRKKLTLDEWREKAFYVVKSPAELDRLLEAVSPLSGIVFVDTMTPVVLAGRRFQGKLQLVFPGPVELRDIGLDREDLDQLTVVGFTSIKAGGQISASLILGWRQPVPRFEAEPGLVLKGNLVAAGGLNFARGGLAGKVIYEPRLRSGDTGKDELWNHHYVAVAPAVRAKGVSRE